MANETKYENTAINAYMEGEMAYTPVTKFDTTICDKIAVLEDKLWERVDDNYLEGRL